MRSATRYLVTAVLLLGAVAPTAAAAELVDEVNPFVGTLPGAADFGTGGGAGNTFPGATTPFGMVAFSPDTSPGASTLSSYSYADTRLRGFSLTHFSGAGCLLYGDVPLLPTTVPVTRSPIDNGFRLVPAFSPAIDHRREQAAPGRYRLTLDPATPRAIESELTATTRTGLARFTFRRGARRSVLLNAGGSTNRNTALRLAIDPRRREVSGMVGSGAFCGQPSGYRIYFSARFSQRFAAHGTWSGQDLRAGSRSVSARAGAGAYVTLGGRGRTVEARVGISFVSVGGARAALAESRGRSFAAVRSGARRTWDAGARARAGERRAQGATGACSPPRSTTRCSSRASSRTATGATAAWTVACTAPAASSSTRTSRAGTCIAARPSSWQCSSRAARPTWPPRCWPTPGRPAACRAGPTPTSRPT